MRLLLRLLPVLMTGFLLHGSCPPPGPCNELKNGTVSDECGEFLLWLEYGSYQTEVELATPDAYEPNDTIEEARCISAQFYHEFTLDNTDDIDFFYFHIENTELTYTFYNDTQDGPLFMNIVLYDTDAQTILVTKEPEGIYLYDLSQFQYQFSTPGTYYLKLFGYDEPVRHGLYVKEPLGTCETGG